MAGEERDDHDHALFRDPRAGIARVAPPRGRRERERLMSSTVAGKAVIVTGGGRGIGRAMVLGLARAGARVMATAAREGSELAALEAEARGLPGVVHTRLADVTVPADCARVADEAARAFGGVDVLVNNAGRGMRYVSERFQEEIALFWKTDPEVWRTIMDTNVNGPFLMARAVMPALLERGWGRIINVSMNVETMQRPGFSPYGPSKAALEAATLIWARECAGTGVTVNALLPGGPTLTGMIPPHRREVTRDQLLDPEIMVPPLLWLASESSDEVTGGRYVAKAWDPALPCEAAAAGAGDPPGWRVSA